MKPVVCFGEALIDFLNTGQEAQDGLNIKRYQQYPGGAPANAAVAVARLGGQACFAGQVGNDQFGHFLQTSLSTYGVDTQFLLKHPTANTALAFVILDNNGERSFSFHRHQSADVIFSQEQINPQWFRHQPLFHICSNTLTDPAIADVTFEAVRQARTAGALVSFDVNLRHNLWPERKADKTKVNQLLQQVDIIKFSLEELEYMAEPSTKSYIQHLLQSGCQLIVVTDGPNTMRCYTQTTELAINPPAVTAVDTTAGGDAFIGGLLFAFSHCHALPVSSEQHTLLETMLWFAANCGALAVTRPGAFPALPQRTEVQVLWDQVIAQLEDQV